MGAIAKSEIDRLIERSVPLKDELFAFGTQKRFASDLDDAIDDRLGGRTPIDEGELINTYDYFFLQHRLADGRLLIDHFVDEHPELPALEREMLLGWRGIVEGLFAVRRREGDALLLDNLIDELTYRTRSNRGREALNQIPVGSFVFARVIPVADVWLLSGTLQIWPRSDRLTVYQIAAQLATHFPHMTFRNPEKLEQAWQIQRDHRAAFIAMFGSDTVVIPGHELPDLMRRFHHFQTFEWRDESGSTVAERSETLRGDRLDPDIVDGAGFDELADARSIAIIVDEIDGMNFYRDYDLVAETYARPELLADKAHKTVVTEYLEFPDVTPLPLRRLAEQHPATVDQLFQRLLGRDDFSWPRDGEDLLRSYKPEYYAEERFPAATPLSEILAKALRLDMASVHNVGRNDPCPCGSGKKYKLCCGAA